MTARIIPGTTPQLSIELDMDVSGCDAMQLCVRYGVLPLLELAGDELTVSADGKTVSARLTEAQTLRLPNNAQLGVQLRVSLGGETMATDVLPISTAATLSRKELSANEYPSECG